MERTLRVLFKDTVWLILDELSRGNKTPTQLAKNLDMSVANIDNFLSRLEDKEIVRRVKKIRNGRGRPFTEYALDKGPVFILVPGEGVRFALSGSQDAIKDIKSVIKKHKGEKVESRL